MSDHGKQPTPAKDPVMSTCAHAGIASPADRGVPAAGRRGPRARAALAVMAAAALGFAAASPATAAEPAWGYEQLSPPDKSSVDVFGTLVSRDGSTVLAATDGAEMPGMPTDGRSRLFQYGLPRGGAPWAVGPFGWQNGGQALGFFAQDMSRDGSWVLRQGGFHSHGGSLFRVNARGEVENMATGFTSYVNVPDADLDSVAFLTTTWPVHLYVGHPDQTPVLASVDNEGNPMSAAALGGADGTHTMGVKRTFAGNAYAADGSSVIFTSTDSFPGDNDIDQSLPWDPVGFKDLYRRILTPGHEETYSITDVNGSGDVDAGFDAEYRWATADQSRVFFVTRESLEPGDTDDENDLYLRDGKDAPVRVSQGEMVDGSPTGNGSYQAFGNEPEWVVTSEDGNRTFFITVERLTQDAPVNGYKLYERDVAEGRTRLVAAPLAYADIHGGANEINAHFGTLVSPFGGATLPHANFRGIRATPDGVVFMSEAPLADAPDDGLRKVFAWTREGLVHVGKPESDAPPSPPGLSTIVPFPFTATLGSRDLHPSNGGRAVSDDGSQVFFSTSQALTREDTDGNFRDIYVWSEADGVRLVSPPGRDRYDVNYIDSSPDGSVVQFATASSILPTDTDPNAIDVYAAILGGGSPPSPQVPDADPRVCEGAACQGAIPSATPPSIGSVSFAGPGNVLTSPDLGVPSVAVSKIKAVTGSVATLKVRVPSAGQISVGGASLRRVERSTSKAGTYTVKVALSARAKSTLRKKKSLRVSVRVAYRASDGQSASKSVLVTFKQSKVKTSLASKKGGR